MLFGRKKEEQPTSGIKRLSSAQRTGVDGASEFLPTNPGAEGLESESENTDLAGLSFHPMEIETEHQLANVVFHEVVNDKINLASHMSNKVAVAQLTATRKVCVLFADKARLTAADTHAVMQQLKNHGYQLSDTGVQGYYVSQSLVLSLARGAMNAARLATNRDIARSSDKSQLFTAFTDIVSWAYTNKADDIDFVVDTTSDLSQLGFKIGGRYIRPERFMLRTELVSQMLGIAWQKSEGGAHAQFETKTEQQAKLNMDLPRSSDNPRGARVNLRWSGMAIDKGAVVTMRIQRLGDSARIRSLEEAGYVDTHMDILRRVIHSEGGLVVFAGVVGSGKSTSLVQLLNMLPDDIKIQTLEDPVELEIKRAYQKTVTRDLLSVGQMDPAFASATRALYRSAMDVLYLGEIRDTETGLVARQVTESGHSVYTTTHARSGLGIIDRFASPAIGIPRDVLATPEIIKLLVYQALLPTNCPHCSLTPDDHMHAFIKKPKEAEAHERYFDRLYRLYGIESRNFKLRNHVGCEHCQKPELPDLNGFEGRTVVAELIEPDERMLEFVLKADNIELNRHWRSMASPSFTDNNLVGKTTMECAIYKAALGQIDPREIEPRFMSFETVEAKRKLNDQMAAKRIHTGFGARA